jgi:hypothetical protein
MSQRVLRFLLWVRAKLQKRRAVDGLMLLALEEKYLDRVSDALALIGRYDPVRYRRLLMDLRRIWVEPFSGAVGRYTHSDRTCWLNTDYVESGSVATIASVIVHEATHARLFRAGIGYEEAVRLRVERCCLRRQRSFADRIPGGAGFVWQEEEFDRLPDYTDAAVAERHRANTENELTRLGVPRWIVFLIMLKGRPRP